MARPRKWNPDEWPLGQVSDSEIARNCNLDASTVRAARVARGIEPYSPNKDERKKLRQMARGARMEARLLKCLNDLEREADSAGTRALVERIAVRIEREVLHG